MIMEEMVKVTYADDKLLINNKYYDFTSNFIYLNKDKIYRHGFRSLIERDENGEREYHLNLPAPGIIYRDFSNYFHPVYYTPAFDYENIKDRYFLGVNSGRTSLQGEFLPYSTYFIFIYDMLLSKPLWIWDIEKYSQDIGFPPSEEFWEPGIESCFRVGENDLGLDEDTLVAVISKINRVLFINPKTDEIKTMYPTEDFSHYIGFNIIPKGLPGENNFLFYNTNTKSDNPSEIVEYNPRTNEIVFRFGCEKTNGKNPLRSFFGAIQKLPNGNYLLYNYMQGLILEITPDKEIIDEISVTPFPGEDVTIEHRINRCSKIMAYPKEWVEKIQNFLDESYKEE